MVNVRSKLCEYDGCDKIPAYAERGAKRAQLCKDHKQPTMVNVNCKSCEFERGCDKRPTNAEKGEKRPRFCITHKQPTMVDVASKRCAYDGCDKQTKYAKKIGAPGSMQSIKSQLWSM